MQTRALESFLKAIFVEGLKEIIKCMGFECLNRILVVSGNEDRDGHLLGTDLFDHTESIQFRHFHIEEDQVWPVMLEGGDDFPAILTFCNNLDVLLT
jgi:hypothetical protein